MRSVLYILGQLKDEDAQWLASVGTRLRASSGTAIIEEGRQTEALYIVLDGTLAATVAGQHIQTVGLLTLRRDQERIGRSQHGSLTSAVGHS
jgi:hypothetical protein